MAPGASLGSAHKQPLPALSALHAISAASLTPRMRAADAGLRPLMRTAILGYLRGVKDELCFTRKWHAMPAELRVAQADTLSREYLEYRAFTSAAEPMLILNQAFGGRWMEGVDDAVWSKTLRLAGPAFGLGNDLMVKAKDDGSPSLAKILGWEAALAEQNRLAARLATELQQQPVSFRTSVQALLRGQFEWSMSDATGRYVSGPSPDQLDAFVRPVAAPDPRARADTARRVDELILSWAIEYGIVESESEQRSRGRSNQKLPQSKWCALNLGLAMTCIYPDAATAEQHEGLALAGSFLGWLFCLDDMLESLAEAESDVSDAHLAWISDRLFL